MYIVTTNHHLPSPRDDHTSNLSGLLEVFDDYRHRLETQVVCLFKPLVTTSLIKSQFGQFSTEEPPHLDLLNPGLPSHPKLISCCKGHSLVSP